MASFRIADATFFQPYLYKEQIIAIYNVVIRQQAKEVRLWRSDPLKLTRNPYMQ